MMKKKRRESGSFLTRLVNGVSTSLRQRPLTCFVFDLFCLLAVGLFFVLLVFSTFAPSHVPSPPRSSEEEDGGESSAARDLWRTEQSERYYGCSNATGSFASANEKTHPNRFLLIATSGGLNQQRTGITDAVVAAYILNATLVVPRLDQKSFWKDSSNFSEIFDVDRFILFLSDDVRVVKQLPTKSRGQATLPYSMRVPRKCNQQCYLDRVLPALNKRHVVQLSKFDYRLSNKLSKNLQKLRCRVNYHALKFTDPILDMGKKLVERMRMKSPHFIALHLRFEPDMLAFSGCDFGGGEKERKELGEIRKRWKSLSAVSNPEKVRKNGKCPLTPQEVGLMLKALSYGSDVHVYVASGEVYGGEDTLRPLKELFPNLHTKETIASKEELAPFSSFSSRMAALDFIVCDESDVFATNNNGNMARMLAGRRKYFGHKPTIRPNAKKLYKLFMNRDNMTWEQFSSSVKTQQIGFMGAPKEVKPGRGEFHENPEACICDGSKMEKDDYNGKDQGKEDEQSSSEIDYVDNGSSLEEKVQLSVMDTEPKAVRKTEQQELEFLFSD